MNNFLICAAATLVALPSSAQVQRASEHYNGKPGDPRSASVDLNGDGKKESIRLVPASNAVEERRYRLTVGGSSISGALDGMAGLSFYIVDINRADRHKEIVVQMDDLALNFDSKIYWFDGRRLRLAGSISGIEAIYKGDGVVAQQNWRGFWTSTDTFRLSRARKLTKMPRQLYPVRKKATVSQSLALYTSRSSLKSAAILEPKTQISVVESDLKGWYRVLAITGGSGWVRERDLLARTSGLPIGD